MLRSLVILVTASVIGLACGSSAVDEPNKATSCAELVQAGRVVAEGVLVQLEELAVADLEVAALEASLIPIKAMMRTEEFEVRARMLGCQPSDLELQACRLYQGLSEDIRSELSDQYLAPYKSTCE